MDEKCSKNVVLWVICATTKRNDSGLMLKLGWV